MATSGARVPGRLAPPVALLVLVLAACGGGSGGSGGDLGFRAVWEGRAGGAGGGPFSPTVPPSVRRIRIVFSGARGLRCCVAVDPQRLRNPLTGAGALLLLGLAPGPATLSVAGFPGEMVPSPEGFAARCPALPVRALEPCRVAALATPSFASDPHPVNILAAVPSDAGDVTVHSLPFAVAVAPPPGELTANPVRARFTVVDAGSAIDAGAVAASLVDGGGTAHAVPLELQPCDDRGADPCTLGGVLDVAGYHAVGAPQRLDPGPAQLRIAAANAAGRTLSTLSPFVVAGLPPPPATPSASPRPTPTRRRQLPAAERSRAVPSATPTATPSGAAPGAGA